MTSSSPLIIAPARAMSGFSHPTALPASAAIVSGLRSEVIAARAASSTTVIVTASVSRLLRTFRSRPSRRRQGRARVSENSRRESARDS